MARAYEIHQTVASATVWMRGSRVTILRPNVFSRQPLGHCWELAKDRSEVWWCQEGLGCHLRRMCHSSVWGVCSGPMQVKEMERIIRPWFQAVEFSRIRKLFPNPVHQPLALCVSPSKGSGCEQLVGFFSSWSMRILPVWFRVDRTPYLMHFSLNWSHSVAGISQEIDYCKEAANAELFARNFKDLDYVKVPKINWELTTPQVGDETHLFPVWVSATVVSFRCTCRNWPWRPSKSNAVSEGLK